MTQKALSRDDIVRILFEKDFFANNPALASIAQIVNPCKIAYVKDSYGRCCGGNMGLMFPALEALFDKLRELKETDQDAVKTFCDFLAKKKGYDTASFMIYYRKQKSGPPIRIALP
jgi:hypothetical protein